MDRSGTTSPRRVPCQTHVRTSGRWCGNRASPSSPWSLLKRCFECGFFFFFLNSSSQPRTYLCFLLFTGAWTGEELPVLAQTGLATQHRDLRSFQDHNAVPHRVGLLRHHRTQDQTPPDGPGEDDLAPAVHGLAGSRLPRRYQRLSQ